MTFRCSIAGPDQHSSWGAVRDSQLSAGPRQTRRGEAHRPFQPHFNVWLRGSWRAVLSRAPGTQARQVVGVQVQLHGHDPSGLSWAQSVQDRVRPDRRTSGGGGWNGRKPVPHPVRHLRQHFAKSPVWVFKEVCPPSSSLCWQRCCSSTAVSCSTADTG